MCPNLSNCDGTIPSYAKINNLQPIYHSDHIEIQHKITNR